VCAVYKRVIVRAFVARRVFATYGACGVCMERLTNARARRTQTIEAAASTSSPSDDEDAERDWWTPELKLSETALRSNPKSYPSWHHRKWVIGRLTRLAPDAPTTRDALERELALCVKLLDMDDRNFHCWAYRRFIVEHLGRSVDDELAYTLEKIENNFSNYSAWHYRSAHLSTEAAKKKETLDKEFELASNAFYTEPEDQSAWMYHRWLTSRARELDDAGERDAALRDALETCREISELEPECKWPLLAQVMLCGESHRDAETFNRLAALDPSRSGYYRDVASG